MKIKENHIVWLKIGLEDRLEDLNTITIRNLVAYALAVVESVGAVEPDFYSEPMKSEVPINGSWQ